MCDNLPLSHIKNRFRWHEVPSLLSHYLKLRELQKQLLSTSVTKLHCCLRVLAGTLQECNLTDAKALMLNDTSDTQHSCSGLNT